MKKIILLTIVTLKTFYSQNVGINTDTPHASLHVYGTMQIDGAIYTGGDKQTLGDPGRIGDFLTSRGEGVNPVWKAPSTIGIPEVVAVANRTIDTNNVSGSYQKIYYNNINYQNSNYIEYNDSTQSFRINKAGYYQIDAYAVITEIPSGDGTKDSQYGGTVAVRAIGRLNGENQLPVYLSSSTGTPGGVNRDRRKRESISGVTYIPEGIELSIEVTYTRDRHMNQSGVSIIYLSK